MRLRSGIALTAAAVVGSGQALCAQDSLVIRGHVVRQAVAGMVPMAGTLVTLHRIGPSAAGAIDSLRTDRRGAFAFRVAADSASMYLATSRHAGIAYFAPPTRLGDAPGESEIVVFDTTSAAVTLRVSGRHLVVSAPNASGARELVEVYEIQNDTIVTAVSTDPNRPAFQARLPAGARNVRATQGDFTGGAVRVEGSTARIMAPIAPGVRQLVLTYELEAGVFPLALALDLPADVLEVLLEEQAGRVEGGALQAQGPVTVEGRNFSRFLGRDVPAGASVSVVVPDRAPALPAWAPGALLGIVSLIIVALAVRRRPQPAPATVVAAGGPATWSADELREALDGVNQVLASETTIAAARPALENYRAELEAALARSLASPPSVT